MNEQVKETHTSERDWKAYARELEKRCQQAEAERDQAKEEANLLIQHAPSAIYEIDYSIPGFKSVNDAMCKMLGYAREELLAMNPFHLLDDAGKVIFQERTQKILRGETVDPTVEYRIKTKDQGWIDILQNISLKFKDGEPYWAMVVAHDITERKQAEVALVKSEEKFAKAFRSSPLALAISTLNEGRFLEVNDSYICLLGYSREELIGHTSIELGLFTDPKERQGIARLISEEKGFRDYPIRLLSKEGNPRDLLFSAEAIEIGGQACLLSLVTDVTEKNRAEEDLKASQQRLVDFLESTHDSFFALDRNWRLLYANQQFCNLMQRKPAELIGKNFWEEFPSYRGTQVEQYYHLVMEERKPVHFEMEGLYTDHWFEMSLYPTQEGISVFCENRTGKHQAEEALRQSEAREKARRAELEAIMDAAPAMIWISRDPECQEMVGNLYGNNFLGMGPDDNLSKTASPEDRQKQPYTNYYQGKEIPSAELPMQLAASKGITTKDYEFDVVFDNGQVKTIFGDVVPIWDERGKPSGSVGVFLDITERKMMELALTDANQFLEQKVKDRTAELVRAAQELEKALQAEKYMRQQLIQSEKYAALARLVASVAHEINNPLQTIQNSMYLLKGIIKDGNGHEFMDMALAESKRIGTLVLQLRETYRPTKEAQATEFNLVDLLNSVQALMQPQFRQNDVMFEMQSDGQVGMVYGVQDQLKQVFLNICLNAVDAIGSKGGQIWIDISQHKEQRQIWVAIRDTGPGIPTENVQKIFEPFFTTKEKGTGLGLAISYEIIKNHGGDITVESEPGKGAMILVRLPLKG